MLITDWYPDIWIAVYEHYIKNLYSVSRSILYNMFHRITEEPLIIPSRLKLYGLFWSDVEYLVYSIDEEMGISPLTHGYPEWFFRPEKLTGKDTIIRFAPSEYVESKVDFPIENTLKVIECPECNGRGWIKQTCPECGGTGRTPCPECGGRGYVLCPVCYGVGYIETEDYEFDPYYEIYRKVIRQEECPRCGGTGRVLCSYCKGEGYFECIACKGTGFIRLICQQCEGKGKVVAWKNLVIKYEPEAFVVGHTTDFIEKVFKDAGIVQNAKSYLLLENFAEKEIREPKDLDDIASEASKKISDKIEEALTPLNSFFKVTKQEFIDVLKNEISKLKESVDKIVRMRVSSFILVPLAIAELYTSYKDYSDNGKAHSVIVGWMKDGSKVVDMNSSIKAYSNLRASSIFLLIIGLLMYGLAGLKLIANLQIPLLGNIGIMATYEIPFLFALGTVFALIIPFIIGLIDRPKKIGEAIIISKNINDYIKIIKDIENRSDIKLLLSPQINKERLTDPNDPEACLKYFSLVLPILGRKKTCYIKLIRTIDYDKYVSMDKLRQLSSMKNTDKIYVLSNEEQGFDHKRLPCKIIVAKDTAMIVEDLAEYIGS